jgi:uncharacterized delta-60 repeat protein
MRTAIALLTLLAVPAVVRAADADLDRSFGSLGFIELNPSPYRDLGSNVALQGDGKILLTAPSNGGGGGTWFVARLTADGALDSTFGDGGAIADITMNGAYAEDVAIQPDGKIVVCGTRDGFGQPKSAVVRYLIDGTPDPDFGMSGVATVDVVPGANDDETPTGLVIQPDGRIVVVGYHYDDTLPNPPVDLVLFRLMPDGALDPDFGTGGIASVSLGADAWAFDVARQADGKLVVTGFYDDGAQSRLVLRLEDDGSLDPTFGSGGVVVDGPGPQGNRFGFAIDVLPDGNILVGGQSGGLAELARYLPNGSADGSFGVAGIADASDPGGQEIAIGGMARRPDGTIVLSGTIDRDPSGFDVAIVRFDADGLLDTSFAPGGVARVVVGTQTSGANGAIAQPNGKIVVTGVTRELDTPTSTHDTRILVARIGNTCGDGTVDPDEGCDDGNAVDGDCCSVACRYEPTGGACGTDDGDPCTFDACDGAGTCVTGQIAPLGTPCGDSDPSPCIAETCDGAGACVSGRQWPDGSCLVPTLPLRSSLLLSDQTDDTRDRLTWKWTRGPEIAAFGGFGNPSLTDPYTFCLFSGSTLIGENPIPTGSDWIITSKGWRVSRRTNPPFGGITKVKLLFGGFGRSRILVSGKGTLLGLPPLPLAMPVTAQLVRNDACYAATYLAPSVNKPTKFRAKGS